MTDIYMGENGQANIHSDTIWFKDGTSQSTAGSNGGGNPILTNVNVNDTTRWGTASSGGGGNIILANVTVDDTTKWGTDTFNPVVQSATVDDTTRWGTINTSTVFDGSRVITNNNLTEYGSVIGGTIVVEFLDNYFFPPKPPSSTLTAPNRIVEYGDPDLDRDLSWSVTKGSVNVSSIDINGTSITATGDNQSGVFPVTIPSNASSSYKITVSDLTPLTDETTISFSFRDGYYWGSWDGVSITPTDTEILNLTGASVGSGKVLATTRKKTFNGINGAGDYLIFAFPASWGDPSFVLNGLVVSAYTKIRDDAFENKFGHSVIYQVWVSNTKQNAAISNFEIK